VRWWLRRFADRAAHIRETAERLPAAVAEWLGRDRTFDRGNATEMQ